MTVTIRIQEIILDYSNAVKTLVSRALETRRIVGVLLDPEKASFFFYSVNITLRLRNQVFLHPLVSKLYIY